MRRRFGSANAVSVEFMWRIYSYRNIPVKTYSSVGRIGRELVGAAVLSLAAGNAGPLSTAREAFGPAGRRCSLEDCRAIRPRVLAGPPQRLLLAASGIKDGRDTKSTRRCVSSQYGFLPEWPQRHSFTVRPSSTRISLPSASATVIGPVTTYGPFGSILLDGPVIPRSHRGTDPCSLGPSATRSGRTPAGARARRAAAGSRAR